MCTTRYAPYVFKNRSASQAFSRSSPSAFCSKRTHKLVPGVVRYWSIAIILAVESLTEYRWAQQLAEKDRKCYSKI